MTNHTIVMYVTKHLLSLAVSRNTNAFILVINWCQVFNETFNGQSPYHTHTHSLGQVFFMHPYCIDSYSLFSYPLIGIDKWQSLSTCSNWFVQQLRYVSIVSGMLAVVLHRKFPGPFRVLAAKMFRRFFRCFCGCKICPFTISSHAHFYTLACHSV